MYSYAKVILSLMLVISSTGANAFQSRYSCTDSSRYCSQGAGYRMVDGMNIYRDCWEYTYTKTCNVPSKNDCGPLIANNSCVEKKQEYLDRDDTDVEKPDNRCLAPDINGSCLNIQKEFMCEKEEVNFVEEEEIVFDPDRKNTATQFLCKSACNGEPCVKDREDNVNEEVGEALYWLTLASKMSEGISGDVGDPPNFSKLKVNIFGGKDEACEDKKFGYANCCTNEGLGIELLGARCRNYERLTQMRNENRCILVGNECVRKVATVCIREKYRYCCFGSVFSKVVQKQGRKQLGKGWGTVSNPSCEGFTLEEIQKLDFKAMDLQEFYKSIDDKVKQRDSSIDPKALEQKVQDSLLKMDKLDSLQQKAGYNMEVKTKNLQDNEISNHPIDEKYLKEKVGK